MNKDNPQVKRKNKFNSTTSLKDVSCLVTGFDPFNGAYHNPSASIAESMPSHLNLNKHGLRVSIKSLILPVTGEEAWSTLRPIIDSLPAKRDSIVIMVGQFAIRKVMGLERFALNFRDYRIKDNSGQKYIAEMIEKNAPDAIRTGAPIEAALNHLLKKGIPIEASNYAGTFICNETYFRVLNHIRQFKLPYMVYFVHVPLPRIYGKALANAKVARWSKLASGKDNQLVAMAAAIKMLIEFSAEMISKK